MSEKKSLDRSAPAGAQGHAQCPFCSQRVRSRAIAVQGSVLAIPDAHPVAEGHCLVITRRHTPDFFTMTPRERRDAAELLDILRRHALREDSSITGFNVGANCGESAGQQIQHAHLHFIPRREEDEQPERGVKGVIRNKLSY
jgi:diadenosine tetraphosphate (Ap4A) HIT family hydrolase